MCLRACLPLLQGRLPSCSTSGTANASADTRQDGTGAPECLAVRTPRAETLASPSSHPNSVTGRQRPLPTSWFRGHHIWLPPCRRDLPGLCVGWDWKLVELRRWLKCKMRAICPRTPSIADVRSGLLAGHAVRLAQIRTCSVKQLARSDKNHPAGDGVSHRIEIFTSFGQLHENLNDCLFYIGRRYPLPADR